MRQKIFKIQIKEKQEILANKNLSLLLVFNQISLFLKII